MPAGYNRFVGRRGAYVLYVRNSATVCRVDTRNGVSTELSTVEQPADPRTLTMTPDERVLFWCEGGNTLVQLQASSGRRRTVYQCPQGWTLGEGMSVSEDGLFATLVESKDRTSRIRLIATVRGNATNAVEAPEGIALRDPVIRSRRAGFFYTRGEGELWMGTFDASQNYKLKTPAGNGLTRSAHWSADGKTVEYLWQPEGAALPLIRECQPDPNDDKLIGPTTRFVCFNRNGDASVFVGASGSKASPHVLLLLRSTKREFTLAEHKASDPSLVTPVFSSNSQRVFFQSDRDGKWAIYSIQVEKLVEDTETAN